METNQLLINYYKKEELKKIKNWQKEGKVNSEIIRLANKEYISVEEIKEALGIDEDEIIEMEETEEIENTVDELDIVIEDEEESIRSLEEQKSNVVIIEDEKLEDYPNQPFKMYDEDKKKEMIESIKINGIMQPLIVRPIENGKYQILAGHNRRNCGREVGMRKFECIVKENLTDDEAKIYLIDTNLCTRENISIMERAKAYRIKYDTYKRQRIETSMIDEIEKDNVGIRGKFVKQEKSSNGSIQRYLRLTYLIPKLQDFVDNNKMSINVGEKVSFLPNREQKMLAEILEEENFKLSENIVKRIRNEINRYDEEIEYGYLSKKEMIDIIKTKKETIINCISVKFTKEELELYFRGYKTEEKLKEYILELAKNI